MTLAALLLVLSAPQASVDVAPPAFYAANQELEAYLLEAADNSPALRMRFAEWRAALERVPQVTTLDDPQFTYTQFLQSDQTRFGLSIMQMFPWFGTLRVRGEQAAAEADAALSRLYAERNALFEEVKMAYFNYGFLHESLETTKRQAAILKEMEETVGNRYSLGLAAEADLLRVQIEQSELEDMYNQYLQERPVFSQRLASAVGREAASELPWPEAASVPPPVPPAPVVMAWLRVKNPALQESDALIEGRRREIQLAKKSGRPNFTLGIEFQDMKTPRDTGPEWPYMYGVDTVRGILTGDNDMLDNARDEAISEAIADEVMPGMDPMSDEIMVSVGLNVPIWRRRIRAGIEEAMQMEQAAISEKRDRTLELDVDARMALFEIQDGTRRYNLYNDVLVYRAQQTYESLMSRYSSGDAMASFLDVLGSVQALLNYELEQIRALRDIQNGAARLERVMGAPWGEHPTDTDTGATLAPAPEIKAELLPEGPSAEVPRSQPVPPAPAHVTAPLAPSASSREPLSEDIASSPDTATSTGFSTEEAGNVTPKESKASPTRSAQRKAARRVGWHR